MNRRARQRGLTLVELLVSIAIGLLLATAASYLFVTTNRVARVADSKAQQQETAAIVLDLIGRDLKNAGFYPAEYPSTATTTNFQGSYTNITPGALTAFNQGIFGCSNAQFDVATGLCPTAVASAPDTLVINYFTADTFSVDGVGTRRDCLGKTVENAAVNGTKYNLARAGGATGSTASVALPLLISNAYSLGGSVTYQATDNQTVSTRSFRCAGNGSSTNPYQPLVDGLTQLQFRYGVADATTLEASRRFYTAADVSLLPAVSIDGEARTGWQRVAAVQVCVVTKTLDTGARQTRTGSYVDCEGKTVNFSASDGALYRQQTRIFGVRNNLTKSF